MSGPYETKKGFNLSLWALMHPALTRYLMVVLMVLGVTAYFQLGQDEDPPFTFRAMVIRTYWPGATAQQVAEQITDKLERTLQEAPFADKIRSYSKPGESQIIFQIKDSSKASEVANVWYTVRKKVSDMRQTLPQGVVGPFFNDDFGDVYGVIYAIEAEGFSMAEIRDIANKTRWKVPAPCKRLWTWCKSACKVSFKRLSNSKPCPSVARLANKSSWVISPLFNAAMSIQRQSKCAFKASKWWLWAFPWPRAATSLP